MRLHWFLAVVTAAALTGSGFAEDKPAARSDADKQASQVALDVVTLGVELFNSGNHEGCARLYEGALMALKPMVAHRPDLAKTVQSRLDRAKALRTPQDRAFALREALDAVMGDRAKETPKAAAKPGQKPLWDRLGGEKGVRQVTRDFLETAAKDKKVNVDRDGNYPLTADRVKRVEQLVVEFISSVTGGPLKYTGRDMKNTHQGMRITEDEFNAAAGHLIAALKKNGVAQAEIDELVGLVAGVAKDVIEVKK